MPASLPRQAVSNNYDRLSRFYDLFSASERRFSESGLRLLAFQPGERLLEIGPGTGHALAVLARTGEVYGIDLSPGMLHTAQLRLARLDLAGRVLLSRGDAIRLPYPQAAFDAAFMSFTLELFSDAEIPLVLAECRRVLRPGGRLGVVSLLKEESPAVRAYEWFHARLPAVVDCRPIYLQPLLQAAGFEPHDSVRESIWGLPAAAVVALRP